MRRGNMGRGRGRGRGGSGGPLMTDHLKIRNLDRELALLRQKREMINREQHLLSMQCEFDRKRQFEYERPRNMPGFDHMWQPSPPKRFNPPPRRPWRDVQPPFPRPSMPRSMGPNINPDSIPPLFNKVEVTRPVLPFDRDAKLNKPVIHPVLKKTITVRKEFNPPKILKNRPFLPNNLNSYPVEQRKNLISQTTGTDPTPAAVLPPLREDEIPTQQMTGRLELALGSLVKELRYRHAQNPQFKALVATAGPLRIVKQAVRERIRSVMLNQPVGSPADIIQKYRLRFSKERDREIVDLVLNSKNRQSVNVVESDDPEQFFKTNINTIIEKKLEEMFSNLQKMYTDARRKAKLTYTKAAVEAINIAKPLNREDEDFDEKKRADAAQKILRSITGKQVTVEERDALNLYYRDIIGNILEEKVVQLLPKYVKYFAKLFDMDQEYKTVKFMSVKRVKEATKAKKAALRAMKKKAAEEQAAKSQEKTNENDVENEASDMNEEEGNEDDEVNESYESQEEEDNEMENETSDTQQAQEEEMKEVDNEEPNTVESQEEEMKEVDNEEPNTVESQEEEMNEPDKVSKESQEEKINKMDSKTDKTVPQEKETTGNVTAEEPTVDKKPVDVKADKIVESTPSTPMSAKTAESPAVHKTAESPAVPKTPVIPPTPSAKDLPYYVKLIGRPNLPARAVICDFLNNYRPKTIKKHKSINNLLVVGFVNRDDYNRILAANETVIGDITIIIKASEPVNPANNDAQKAEETEKKKEEIKETVAKPSGNGLDKQINDLLSTVRKADEGTTKEAAPEKGESEEKLSPSIKSADTEVSKDSEDKDNRKIETIKEVDENGDSQESDKADKGPKGVKESGRATPVRSSSRLANVTPSKIRTRRASRLLQEQ